MMVMMHIEWDAPSTFTARGKTKEGWLWAVTGTKGPESASINITFNGTLYARLEVKPTGGRTLVKTARWVARSLLTTIYRDYTIASKLSPLCYTNSVV